MSPQSDLSEGEATAVATARLVAPSLDRMRQRIAEGLIAELGARDFLGRSQLTLPSAQMFALLRGGLGGRSIPVDGVRAALRYVPAGQQDASLDELSRRGLVDGSPDLSFTDLGRELQRELVEATESVVADVYGGAQPLAARLEPLVQSAVDAASRRGGSAFQVLHPPYLPPSSTPASRLAELVACLRFHRADAHAAAWGAAGFTLEDMVAGGAHLPSDVEEDTDSRASGAYETLTGAQRAELVAGPRALVG